MKRAAFIAATVVARRRSCGHVLPDLAGGDAGRHDRQAEGTKECMLRVTLLNSSASIKRFTLVKAAINRSRTRAAISVRINGGTERVLKGAF